MTEAPFEAEGKQQNVERSAVSFSCRSTAYHAARTRTVSCLLTHWSLRCRKACVLRRCGSVGEVAVLADRLHWFATCRRSALLTGQRLFHQLAAAETASSTVRVV